MKKITINVVDKIISHSKGEMGYYCFTPYLGKPKNIEYIMPHKDTWSGVSLFTDLNLGSPWPDSVDSRLKVALIHECRSILPQSYENIIQTENKFDYILTHDPELLKRNNRYIFFGAGSSRVLDEDAGIHKKTKKFSLIASKKTASKGHRLRHEIANALKSRDDIDFWGKAFKPFDLEKKPSKNEPLKQYMFSITVMNGMHDNYFTDTLVDTFRLGTIPIFWGSRNIGEYFNENGIIRFDTIKELKELINTLKESDYYDRLDAIRDNYERAKKWVSVDERLPDKLYELFEDDVYPD